MADTTFTPTSFPAGQQITCTVIAAPRSKGAEDTIARLMRQDPGAKRALTKSQQERDQTLVVRNRGGRPWCKRVLASKIVRPERGESWTMPFVPHLAADMNSVAKYLKVEKA